MYGYYIILHFNELINLLFNNYLFYGELKVKSPSKENTPANDQVQSVKNIFISINLYIIFFHKTIILIFFFCIFTQKMLVNHHLLK